MVEAWMTYADLAVALHYARGGSPEDHPAGPRVEAQEVHIAALKEAVAKANAIGEQRRQEAEAAHKQIAGMAAEIVAVSNQLATDNLQTEFDKLQAEFNAYWKREAVGSRP